MPQPTAGVDGCRAGINPGAASIPAMGLSLASVIVALAVALALQPWRCAARSSCCTQFA